MPSVLNADEVLADLDGCLGVWKNHQDIKLGKTPEDEITYTAAVALRATLDTNNKAVKEKELELTGLRDHRDDSASDGNDVVTRFRSAVKGLIGPDSAEYEQVGGTRASEIKRSPRKPKVPAAK